MSARQPMRKPPSDETWLEPRFQSAEEACAVLHSAKALETLDQADILEAIRMCMGLNLLDFMQWLAHREAEHHEEE